MTDHIARVREQAEKEALRINRIHRENLGDNEMFDSAYALGFVNGSMWLASRLTREKLEGSLIEVDPDLSEQPNYLKALTDAILGLLERGDDERP